MLQPVNPSGLGGCLGSRGHEKLVGAGPAKGRIHVNSDTNRNSNSY